MTIRNALETDLPAIITIYNAAIPGRMATADLEPVVLESRLGWFHDHSPTHRPIWVKEVDTRVVGWLSFQPFYGRPAYDATAEISIYVHPNHQQMGIGRQLLFQAISDSSTLNLKTLLGFIFAHNYSSLKLFKSLGFQQWGYLPRVAELDGMERDLVIVGLKINEVSYQI